MRFATGAGTLMQEMFRRRRLPDWDMPGATYFVTACLAGSIPAAGLLELTRFRESLAKSPKPDQVSLEDWKLTCWKRTFAAFEEWLDGYPEVNHLAEPALATIATIVSQTKTRFSESWITSN